MNESNERYVIYQIEQFTALKELKTALTQDLNTVIAYTEELDNIETDYFQNSWIDQNGEKNFEICEDCLVNQNNQEIQFIYAKGLFETGLGKEKAIHNGQLLPRNARVFNHETDVCFFEEDRKIYAILKTNQSLEPRIRNTLFKMRNSEVKSKRVKFRNIKNYELNSDFYYWMFYKSINFDNDDRLSFFNISSMSQKDEKKSYNTNSVGNDILNYTNVLSGLGENQEISEAQIGFNYEGSLIVAKIHSNCTFEIDSSAGSSAKQIKLNISKNEFINTAIFIYKDLIPTLLKKYNAEKKEGKWNEDNKSNAIKEWALLAITNLCVINDISTEEIDKKLDATN